MKEPKTDRFDPTEKESRIKPEAVDLSDAPAIKSRESPADSPTEKKEPSQESQAAPTPEESDVSDSTGEQTTKESDQSVNGEVMTSRNHDSMMPRAQDDTIETIRKTVKEIGREPTTLRLTPEEKRRLTDVVYTYKRQGIKTSENEVVRVALTALLEDYSEHGKDSLLEKVIEALNA